MAIFEAQISAQVTTEQKDHIGATLHADRQVSVGVTEADVIREALAFGLAQLTRVKPGERVERYARRRRGLD